jgi:hypothetical protein
MRNYPRGLPPLGFLSGIVYEYMYTEYLGVIKGLLAIKREII